MSDQAAQPPSNSPSTPSSSASTPFDLKVHFGGAFVFSVKTEGNSADDKANLSSVEVYAPACGHSHAASINQGNAFMLESHWHCLHPAYGSNTPPPLTLGQLKTNIAANTPWTAANRPIGSGWELAFALPFPPNDWQCDLIVPTNPGTPAACFSGNDVGIIPSSVAIDQVLIYKQVLPSTKLHGACFPITWPTDGSTVDLFITSESPYIPTKRHERRAIDAMATLLGLDLLLENPLGAVASSTGAFHPMKKTGGCSMAIVSGPVSTSL